jgi:hypothetical protein
VRLWNAFGVCLNSLRAPTGCLVRCLAATGPYNLAAAFTQAQPFDPHEFRLLPQTQAQRERRQAALQQRRAQEAFFTQQQQYVRTIHWQQPDCRAVDTGMLALWNISAEAVFPPLAVTSIAAAADRCLVAGDSSGRLHVWDHSGNFDWKRVALFQLVAEHEGAEDDAKDLGIAVVCIEPLEPRYHPGKITVSVASRSSSETAPCSEEAVVLRIPRSLIKGGVLVMDLMKQHFVRILHDHTDSVHCLCACPDGALITGGGKYDASVKVWDRFQLDVGQANFVTETIASDSPVSITAGEVCQDAGASVSENVNVAHAVGGSLPVVNAAAQILKEPGYIVSAAILPDKKAGSTLFALAGARYNVVKICL